MLIRKEGKQGWWDISVGKYTWYTVWQLSSISGSQREGVSQYWIVHELQLSPCLWGGEDDLQLSPVSTGKGEWAPALTRVHRAGRMSSSTHQCPQGRENELDHSPVSTGQGGWAPALTHVHGPRGEKIPAYVFKPRETLFKYDASLLQQNHGSMSCKNVGSYF